MTGNAMAKRKWIIGQTMVYKTLHRKLKDFSRSPHHCQRSFKSTRKIVEIEAKSIPVTNT